MGIFDNLKLIPLSNEAGWHKSIERSFLFVSPASMRVAADELIIELYREVFFEKRSGDGKYKKLNPEEQETEEKFVFEDSEKYSLYMAEGENFKIILKIIIFILPCIPPLLVLAGQENKTKEYYSLFSLGQLHNTYKVMEAVIRIL